MAERTVFITGGTSGLGKELVKRFLESGYIVIATGRQSIPMPGYEDHFRLFRTDFSDLQNTADTILQICSLYKFDIVINNAGTLSPPEFTSTKNGNEYTFQVNYLAHMLIDEIIIKYQAGNKPFRICAITSPVYKIASDWLRNVNDKEYYNPAKAYSVSKLMLALMCRDLSSRHPEADITGISFNPGIFSSGIFRMQGRFFHLLYHIAAPFMKSPVRVSKVLFNVLMKENLDNGSVYRSENRIVSLAGVEYPKYESLVGTCYETIKPFLNY